MEVLRLSDGQLHTIDDTADPMRTQKIREISRVQ